VPFEVEFGLDAAGHLNAVRDASTQEAYWSLSATDGAGRITGEVLGQGITTTRKWFGERDRVATILTTAASGGTLQTVTPTGQWRRESAARRGATLAGVR